MTSKQIAILNSLVTYAAENIPGGLSEDELEVTRIVGSWVLGEKMADYPLSQEEQKITDHVARKA